jgi:hypothetical protein
MVAKKDVVDRSSGAQMQKRAAERRQLMTLAVLTFLSASCRNSTGVKQCGPEGRGGQATGQIALVQPNSIALGGITVDDSRELAGLRPKLQASICTRRTTPMISRAPTFCAAISPGSRSATRTPRLVFSAPMQCQPTCYSYYRRIYFISLAPMTGLSALTKH